MYFLRILSCFNLPVCCPRQRSNISQIIHKLNFYNLFFVRTSLRVRIFRLWVFFDCEVVDIFSIQGFLKWDMFFMYTIHFYRVICLTSFRLGPAWIRRSFPEILWGDNEAHENAKGLFTQVWLCLRNDTVTNLKIDPANPKSISRYSGILVWF